MNSAFRNAWLPLVIGVILSAFYFWEIALVPFHPDESTQLWMSADFELFLRDPLALAWTPGGAADDLRQHYRLVDAPLTRYLLGLGRTLTGRPALPVDWDWSKSWEGNRLAGALPDPGLLNAGRFSLALLFPLDLLLIYRIGIRMQGRLTGLLAALLFGLNALALLHTRRAMAEAALVYGTLLVSWSFVEKRSNVWLIGVALALAVNAKQTAVALLPIGLLAAALQPLPQPREAKGLGISLIWRWLQLIGAFSLVTLMLNPVLWKYPLSAAKAAWLERQELLTRQTADHVGYLPENASDTLAQRAGVLIAHLYMMPPTFAETANYRYETRVMEQAYLSIPGHNLLRGFVLGGVILALTLFGMGLALLDLRKAEVDRRDNLLLLLFVTLMLIGGIVWLTPLPWQRYVMSLVPLICLWVAYGIGRVSFPIVERRKNE